MLTITIKANAPLGQAIGVKEDLAMHLEKFGDVRAAAIREDGGEQMWIGDARKDETWVHWTDEDTRALRACREVIDNCRERYILPAPWFPLCLKLYERLVELGAVEGMEVDLQEPCEDSEAPEAC